MKVLKFIVEQHPDGFIAYPLGMNGVVVGEGDTAAEALTDARSAAAFHIASFGSDAFTDQEDVIEAFVTEFEVAG